MPCNAKKEIGCPKGRKCCDCDYYKPYVCETESEADEGQAGLSNSTDGLCCDWSHSEGNERWYTSCGENWQHLDGEMKFCFNCGKKIKDTTR